MKLSRRVLTVVSVAALASALTYLVTQPAGTGVRIEAGEASGRTLKAPRAVSYVSELKTKEAQDQAEAAVPAVVRKDANAPATQDAKLTAAVTAIGGIRADQVSTEQKVSRLQAVLPETSPEEARGLLELDDATWTEAATLAKAILTTLQTRDIRESDLAEGDSLAAAEIGPQVATPVRTNAILLAKKLLVPNLLEDRDATAAARQQAKDAIEPVRFTIERDQVLAYRGQVLTELEVERLAAAGLSRPLFSWQKTAGIFLLILLFSSLLLAVAPRFAVTQASVRRMTALLSVLAILITTAGVLVPVQPILAYVFPIAAAVSLLAIFYGSVPAVIGGVTFAGLFSLAYGGSFELFFIHLAASLGIVLFAGRVTNIIDFLKVGAVAGAVTLLGMVAFSLLGSGFEASQIPKFAVAAALNAALTASLVFAGAAFLGGPLGIVTFLQLLELENPRQELLRRLTHEAPATYSHSLRIARLVEAGAEEIGADPLLGRIQALYHDVGKLSAPEYFTENQGGDNPHDITDPYDSAEIVRAHVSEGLALAREYRLPEAVAAAIPEHHGTFVMSYFLHEARGGRRNVDPDDFRYLGPKPQSRETALLMLADATESASRSLDNPTPEDLDKLIQTLITERVADGQLEEAPISTRDLTKVKRAFVQVLVSDLHKRVKYPKRDQRS